jgi:hypothetical protein
MSIEGFILSAVIALIFMLFLAYPFWKQKTHDQLILSQDVQRQRERVLLYYERVLRNIHDLDEDHSLGKLDSAEYQVERGQWVARGVTALKTLETLDEQHLFAPADADIATVDQAIDRSVNELLKQPQQDVTTS